MEEARAGLPLTRPWMIRVLLAGGWSMDVGLGLVGEKTGPFRQPWPQVGGCKQRFRRVWACAVGESPGKWGVELSALWGMVRVRCRQVVE